MNDEERQHIPKHMITFARWRHFSRRTLPSERASSAFAPGFCHSTTQRSLREKAPGGQHRPGLSPHACLNRLPNGSSLPCRFA